MSHISTRRRFSSENRQKETPHERDFDISPNCTRAYVSIHLTGLQLCEEMGWRKIREDYLVALDGTVKQQSVRAIHALWASLMTKSNQSEVASAERHRISRGDKSPPWTLILAWIHPTPPFMDGVACKQQCKMQCSTHLQFLQAQSV